MFADYTAGRPHPFTVNCSMLLSEFPLVERAGVARENGFTKVEFWWPFGADPQPPETDVEGFVSSLDAAGVSLTGLNFSSGDMANGDRGLLSDVEKKDEFRRNVASVVDIGERTGCKKFNALYGLRSPRTSFDQQDELAIDNVVYAAESVSKIGGTVLIEPVSGIEDYPIGTARDAIQIIERVKMRGVSNVAMLADLYHLAQNGENVEEVVKEYGSSIGHVQIADAPGRGAPGTGDLPLFDWLKLIVEQGYEGPVGLEYSERWDVAFAWLE